MRRWANKEISTQRRKDKAQRRKEDLFLNFAAFAPLRKIFSLHALDRLLRNFHVSPQP